MGGSGQLPFPPKEGSPPSYSWLLPLTARKAPREYMALPKVINVLRRRRAKPAKKSGFRIRRSEGPDVIPGSAIGFSYTDKDHMLVPGMLKSFSFAEFVISFYDSNQAADFQFNESERHKSIIRKARRLGAKYFWGVGPKRRLGEQGVEIIRRNLHYLDEGYCLFTHYRFLWGKSLDQLRVDGFWGERKTSAFFPISIDNAYGRKPLHHSWHPKNLPRKYVDMNQYYIGRHTEEALQKKFDFYKSRDYKGSFWDTAVIEDLVHDRIETRPLSERIIGISNAEWAFRG